MISFNEIFPADVVEVQGKPFLFTNARVRRDTVPSELFVYDVRDDCDGEFWELQEHVIVNHWGTCLGLEELKLDSNGQYWCPEENGYSAEGDFIAHNIKSYEEFKKGEYDA